MSLIGIKICTNSANPDNDQDSNNKFQRTSKYSMSKLKISNKTRTTETETQLFDTRNDEKNVEEFQYLVGNRQMAEFPVAMSLIASIISGVSLIGLSTEIYLYGILYVYTIPTIILAASVCWYIFLPIFCNLNLTSIYEYFEMRFNKKIRLFGSFVNFIGILFWMPMVIYMPGLVMNQFIGINIHLFSGIISLICVFYTCLGGIQTVIWTDFFQSFIMLASIGLIMIKGIVKVGGLQRIIDINYDGDRIELPRIFIDPYTRYSLSAILIGGTVSWIEGTCCGQVMMQRFLSVSSVKKARKVLIYYITGISLLLGVCVFNGLILYAYYHNCDPLTTKLAEIKDQLLPLFIMEIFHKTPGINGLFIGGIMSAALSTLSTGLNSLAAIFLEDFLKSYYSKSLSNYQTKLILKLTILGAICGGPLFGLFLAGVLMPWINSSSALTGCSFAFILISWICIRSQILEGNSIYIQKPVSITECNYTFILNVNQTALIHELKESGNQSISYLWYCPLGAFVTILVANLASIYFGHICRKNWDKRLIASFLWKLIPEDRTMENCTEMS
ncbi:sodium-coupled monocarboxylate transporter 1-like [Condylostylus longicornis]|uniref:sodium-coupled monocarboxylate transporter 1-like n=1 Tax=Condylostylus longicornis TaxID=2530218 RepID=UPI00244E0918|nr:sodium-coupled monocarboxylate transporter 1-like [Condylostylus longicornis]